MSGPRAIAVGFVLAFAASGPIASGHDLPNERVDRATQATVSPGKLEIAYHVGLADLTVALELRQLGVEVPGGDLAGLFEAYGRETAILNARGFLVEVDGAEVELKSVGFDLVREAHPTFVFRFEAAIPPSGRLSIRDTNFASSEGTSRLGIRPSGPVRLRGDDLPGDLASIPIRPALLLTDAEERRTKQVRVDYGPGAVPPAIAPVTPPDARPADPGTAESGLSRLLDDAGHRAWPLLIAAAFVLGAGHAIQPGHGKTLVAAASLGAGGGPLRGAALGLATATAHLASVALIAGLVAAARLADYRGVDRALARAAGLIIAAAGCWRVGHHLAGFGAEVEDHGGGRLGPARVVALGIAGGAVPCWDAVALVVVAAAIGRLGLGLALLAGFSLGMAAVLVGVGVLARRIRSSLKGSGRAGRWERRLGLAGGLLLAGVGLGLLAR